MDHRKIAFFCCCRIRTPIPTNPKKTNKVRLQKQNPFELKINSCTTKIIFERAIVATETIRFQFLFFSWQMNESRHRCIYNFMKLIDFKSVEQNISLTLRVVLFLAETFYQNFSMGKNQIACCCCCRKRNFNRSNESFKRPNVQSKFKAAENMCICEICGRNVVPKEFCGVRRIRCPSPPSIVTNCKSVFPSFSKETLGIPVSQSTSTYFVSFLKFIHFLSVYCRIVSTTAMTTTPIATMKESRHEIRNIHGWTGAFAL